jgi:tRNA U55 pseudouridine synthase TruB
MSALARTAIGEFGVAQSVPLDTLTRETLPQHIQPALGAVASLRRIQLIETQLTDVRHGQPIRMPRPVGVFSRLRRPAEDAPLGEEWAAIDAAGQLVAILFEKQQGQLWPKLNFGIEPPG